MKYTCDETEKRGLTPPPPPIRPTNPDIPTKQ